MKYIGYIGWIIFIWGLFLFIMFWLTIGPLMGKTEEIREWLLYQTLNILTIGVGSYLIKNFTPEKK
jgi:hypothetical protein